MLLMKIRNPTSTERPAPEKPEFMLLMKIRNIVFPVSYYAAGIRIYATYEDSKLLDACCGARMFWWIYATYEDSKLENIIQPWFVAFPNLCYLWRFETLQRFSGCRKTSFWIYATYEDSKPKVLCKIPRVLRRIYATYEDSKQNKFWYPICG